MECPICKDPAHVEVDTHSDGYAENLQECGGCGALWISEKRQEIILHGNTSTLTRPTQTRTTLS